MQYGSRIEVHKCAACHERLSIPAHYQSGEYYHKQCFEDAVAALANAERIAREVNPTLFIHEGIQPS